MKQNYTPPNQGLLGQIFDSILILVLVYASLMLCRVLPASGRVTCGAA